MASSPSPPFRILTPADLPALLEFLTCPEHRDSSMFLRGNARAVGIIDQGERLHATYAARFDASGRVEAVVAHAWNGRLLFQAPSGGAELARLAQAASRRPVHGMLGPWSQIDAARTELGLKDVPVGMNSKEGLYGVNLADLQLPEALARGEVKARRARPEDLETLSVMRHDFRVEGLRELPSAELLEECRDEVRRNLEENVLFALEDGRGQVVSTCNYNASVEECVQIGAVWTPTEHRGRRYAGAVVAGALLVARAEGKTRSLLFTGDVNVAAQAVYRRLGYQRVGEYGLIFFRGGHTFDVHFGALPKETKL